MQGHPNLFVAAMHECMNVRPTDRPTDSIRFHRSHCRQAFEAFPGAMMKKKMMRMMMAAVDTHIADR